MPEETVREDKDDDGVIRWHISQLPLDMKVSQAILILSVTQGDASKQTFDLIPIFATGRVFFNK